MIENPTPAKRPTFTATFAAIFKGQLSRAKTAAIPIFLAATLQSVGLVVLLKGLVDTGSHVTQQSVVAGSSVTVVSFVALNLLAPAVRCTEGLGCTRLLRCTADQSGRGGHRDGSCVGELYRARFDRRRRRGSRVLPLAALTCVGDRTGCRGGRYLPRWSRCASWPDRFAAGDRHRRRTTRDVAGDVSRHRAGPSVAGSDSSGSSRRPVDVRGRCLCRIVQTHTELDDDWC